MNELEPNAVLRGRYRVKGALAPPSGFNRTYLAEDIDRPGSPLCVIKQLRSDNRNQTFLENAKRLFYTEAVTLEQLGKKHDRIPQLLAFFVEHENFYLVQDFIEGRPLDEELRVGYQWSEEQVQLLLGEVLEILKFVHSQGVIHRDLKPDNLIRRSSDRRLVLVDFGAVKQILPTTGQDGSKLTVSVGTPGYMPAEQLNGMPSPSSDLYALGIIAIQALTGIDSYDLPKDPTTGEIIWQASTSASHALKQVLTQMVRYHFRERYQSAEEVLQALNSLNQTRTPRALITGLHRLFTRQTSIFKPANTSNTYINSQTALISNTTTTPPQRTTLPTEIAQSAQTQHSTTIVSSPTQPAIADMAESVDQDIVSDAAPTGIDADAIAVESVDEGVDDAATDLADNANNNGATDPSDVVDPDIADHIAIALPTPQTPHPHQDVVDAEDHATHHEGVLQNEVTDITDRGADDSAFSSTDIATNDSAIAPPKSVKEPPPSMTSAMEQPIIEQPIIAAAIAVSGTQIIEPPKSITPTDIPAVAPATTDEPFPPKPSDSALASSALPVPQRSRLVMRLGGVLILAGVTVGTLYWFQQQQYRKYERVIATMNVLKNSGDYDQCIQQSETFSSRYDNLNLSAQNLLGECRVAQAVKLAEQDQFEAAIALINRVTPDMSSYVQVSPLLQKWASVMLANATNLYRQGEFEAAIAVLKVIPENTPMSEQAKKAIADWQAEQQANQTYLNEAQQALSEQKWQTALNTIKLIQILGAPVERNSPYWNSTLQPIAVEAEQKLAEQQRQQEAAERARQQQTSNSNSSRNQSSGSSSPRRQSSGGGSSQRTGGGLSPSRRL
jgi:serine/threonine protein kinase/uncharacterized membrane protein YgcG